MQCPTCGFENMPGLRDCARCLSPLRLDEVEVTPYRAGDGRAWRRSVESRGRSLGAVGRRMWDGLTDLGRWTQRHTAYGTHQGPPFRVRAAWVAASIVPGAGQLLAGRRRRGWILMGIYGAALLGSVLFMYEAWGFCFAVMLAVHTFAVVDCVTYLAGYLARWLVFCISIAVFMGLMHGPYRGTAWLLHGLGELQPLQNGVGSQRLLQGDVLWVEGRWLAPERFHAGDAVSYRIARVSGEGWYVPDGIFVGRVMAEPGSRVVFRPDGVQVDGQAVPAHWFGYAARPTHAELTLPEGVYLIYPTGRMQLPTNMRGEKEADLRLRIAQVTAKQVIGRVRMVVSPIHRAGRL